MNKFSFTLFAISLLLLSGCAHSKSTGEASSAGTEEQTSEPSPPAESAEEEGASAAKSDADLVLPTSTTRWELTRNRTVSVTRTDLRVDGESVASRPAPRAQGNAFAIPPLIEALGSADEAQGRLTLAVDRTTPAGLVNKVMYSVGRAGISKMQFAVRRRSGEEGNVPLVTPRLKKLPTGEVKQVVPTNFPETFVAPTSSGESGDRPLDLTVYIKPDGIELRAGRKTLSPVEDCPDGGPTICLTDPSADVAGWVEALKEAGPDDREALTGKITDAYDWRALYNKLAELKQQNPGVRVMKLATAKPLPFQLVIGAMDVARYRLESDSYETRKAFRAAAPKAKAVDGEERRFALFPATMITLVQ
jgi:hypothetical protein